MSSFACAYFGSTRYAFPTTTASCGARRGGRLTRRGGLHTAARCSLFATVHMI